MEDKPRRGGRTALLRQGAVALVFCAAGILFATSAGTAQGTDLRSEGSATLADLLRQEDRRIDENDQAIADLKTEVAALSQATGDQETRELGKRADALSGPAQLDAVDGPGLTVRLDDAPSDRTVPRGGDPNVLVVHQQDVQAVVNALWASGAEAMTLMGQRVISTSAVRCVGTTLHLQGRVYSPPYVVSAIGPVAEMRRALDRDRAVQAFRDDAARFGLEYSVRADTVLEMPGFDGSTELRYARAVPPGFEE